MADKIFSISHDIENAENRKAVEQPDFNINHLDNYPSKYEDYFNTNFSLRNYLLKYYNRAVVKYLGKSPLPDKVIFGKDNWLFYGENHLNTYRGLDRFTSDELEDIKKELFYRYEYLKKRNIKFYFVILPTKYSVYPEYLQNNITKLFNETITDQLIGYLGKKTPFPVIDTRQALIEAKKHQIRLFQKTDSHWNYAGGYFAYHLISQYLKIDFPEIITREFDEFKIDSNLVKAGDISKMLGTDDKEKEMMIMPVLKIESTTKIGKKHNYDPKGFSIPIDYEVVWTNPVYKKPKGLIIRDSFSGYLIPYLKEDFAKSVFIFDRWEYGLNEDIIEQEKPDVFMNIVLECHLKKLLNTLSYKKANQLTEKQ